MKLKIGDAARLRGAVPVSRCWRKRKWATKADADQHLATLLLAQYVRAPERLNVFRCPLCRAWHVGHSDHERRADR
jgi:hypothetical protein